MFLRREYRDRALGILGAFGLLAVALMINGVFEASARPVSTADALHAVNLTPETHCVGCDVVC